MDIITRNVLHPEFEITALNRDENDNIFPIHMTRQQLEEKIDLAKTYLIKEFNAKKGQHVVMCITYWPNYPIWLFACAELGMKFIISDFPKTVLAMEKMPLYKTADIVLWDMVYPPGYDQPQYASKKLHCNVLDTYKPTEIVSPVWCEPEDSIMITTSSGTTATPKLIEHNHEFFFRMMNSNAVLYDLKENEKCWHDKNLQHGVILGVYFLPLANRCKSHFHAPIGWDGGEREELLHKAMIDTVQAEKINRIAVFFDAMEWFSEGMDLSKKQHDQMKIHYIGAMKEKYLSRMCGDFGYIITPQFGSQEVGGPVFYCEIGPDNYKEWNLRNYGTPSPFYKEVTTEGDKLLKITDYRGNVIHTGDRFDVEDGVFTFIGRADLCRINGKTVYYYFLNSVVAEVTGLVSEKDFDVVFDSDLECWYIRTNEELDLEELNKKMLPHIDPDYYSIRSQVTGPREMFYYDGWKFSNAMVRLAVTNGIEAIR